MQLELTQIRTDGGTQPRASYHFGVVDSYAEDMDTGATFPPVTVFYDGTDYWLADGFHRLLATRKLERATIEADVRQGTQQDAQWYSYSVNQTHGLRRTNEDKRRAILAALQHPKAVEMSDRAIADYIGVHYNTVAEYRQQLTITKNDSQPTIRAGKDGRKINTSNIGKKKQQPKSQSLAYEEEDDEPLTPYEEQIAAGYTPIAEPASVGEVRLIQIVNELIQILNYADFRRLVELAAERIAVDV